MPLGTLRKQGRLGWDMVLDLTRDVDEWQTYASPREARAAMRRRYQEDRWLGQLYYPILIVEKDTMEPVAKPMARRWQMPFASSRGYGSLKLQHDIAELHRERGRIDRSVLAGGFCGRGISPRVASPGAPRPPNPLSENLPLIFLRRFWGRFTS
jgi:hypothetical protein